MNNKNEIFIDGMRYNERELAQLIRRKTCVKIYKTPKNYTRKTKHKNNIITNE